MTKIAPLGCQPIRCQIETTPRASTPFNNQSGISSLRSASKGSISSVLLAPLKFIWKGFISVGRFISNSLCCFCTTRGSRQILDWEIAKESFSTIYAAVITSTAFETDRQKTFQKGLGELSSAATERFYQHIGFELAAKEKPPITDRVKQEQYYKEKCPPQRVREYLGNVNNDVLKNGVRSFQAELEQKTK